MKLRRCFAVGLAALTVAAGVLAGGATSSAAPASHPAQVTAEPEVGTMAWNWRFIGPGEGNCRAFEFCIWWATGYGGQGVAFGGNVVPCDGIDWRNTIWENHVYSIKNNTVGTILIYNRVVTPINGWILVFQSPPGNKGNLDLAGGKYADIMHLAPCTAIGSRLRKIGP